MAEIEYILEPDSVTDDIRWEMVTLVDIHPEIALYRELAGRGAGHPNSPPFRTHRAQFRQ